MTDENYVRWLDNIPGSLTILLRIKQKVLKKSHTNELDDICGIRDKIDELQSIGLVEVHEDRVSLTSFGRRIAELIEDINSFFVGAIEFVK